MNTKMLVELRTALDTAEQDLYGLGLMNASTGLDPESRVNLDLAYERARIKRDTALDAYRAAIRSELETP